MRTSYRIMVSGRKYLNGGPSSYEFSGTVKTERRESIFGILCGLLDGIEDDIEEIEFPTEIMVEIGASKVTKKDLKNWFKVDSDKDQAKVD